MARGSKLALAATGNGIAARRGWSTVSLSTPISPCATLPPGIICAPSSSSRSGSRARCQGMLMASRWCGVVVLPDGVGSVVLYASRPLPLRCRTFRRSLRDAVSIAAPGGPMPTPTSVLLMSWFRAPSSRVQEAVQLGGVRLPAWGSMPVPCGDEASKLRLHTGRPVGLLHHHHLLSMAATILPGAVVPSEFRGVDGARSLAQPPPRTTGSRGRAPTRVA